MPVGTLAATMPVAPPGGRPGVSFGFRRACSQVSASRSLPKGLFRCGHSDLVWLTWFMQHPCILLFLELFVLAISPGSGGRHGGRIWDLLPMGKHESYDGILRFNHSR
jgi:hypothetical protein